MSSKASINIVITQNRRPYHSHWRHLEFTELQIEEGRIMCEESIKYQVARKRQEEHHLLVAVALSRRNT
jgi:hypothetical protein